jgi:hypothetical protein
MDLLFGMLRLRVIASTCITAVHSKYAPASEWDPVPKEPKVEPQTNFGTNARLARIPEIDPIRTSPLRSKSVPQSANMAALSPVHIGGFKELYFKPSGFQDVFGHGP